MIPLSLFIVATIARAFFELSRTALINVKKHRFAEIEKRNKKMADAIRDLTEDSSRLLVTAEVGVMLSVVFATGIAGIGFSPLLEPFIKQLTNASAEIALFISQVIVLSFTALGLFVFGKMIPQSIALRKAEPVALACVTPMRIFAVAFAPLAKIAVFIVNIFTSPFGVHQNTAQLVTEEEIKTMVDASQEGGLIEEKEKEMILSVLNFGDTIAREVMVPRIDVIALDVTEDFDQALEMVISSNHSRLPVYRDTIDDIIGVLYTKDLLKSLRDNQRPALETMLRQVLHTPESKLVSDLLKEMQSRRLHIAVIVDEYGGTSGIVTIEDILEEIVGEIKDEYDDAEETDVQELPNQQGFILNAGLLLDDVNEILAIELISDQSDTLGGYIFDQLGEVPNVGAKVEHDGKVFEVLEVNDRRIIKVKVTNTVNEPSETLDTNIN